MSNPFKVGDVVRLRKERIGRSDLIPCESFIIADVDTNTITVQYPLGEHRYAGWSSSTLDKKMGTQDRTYWSVAARNMEYCDTIFYPYVRKTKEEPNA